MITDAYPLDVVTGAFSYAAGIQRIVHVSITHPSADSPYPYFRGKALVEQLLAETCVRGAVGRRAAILSVPGPVVTTLSRALSPILNDTVLTADEYHAMADGLADSDSPTTGTIALTDWITAHASTLGHRYANELDRHFRPPTLRAAAEG